MSEQEALAVVEAPFVADPAKHAWVTWAIQGDRYVPGALVFADTLAKHGSRASKVVLISSDVSKEARHALSNLFDSVIEVPVIVVESELSPKEKQLALTDKKEVIAFQKYAFTKLHALNLTQFSKIALVDADSLCIGANPDNIFAVPAPAGLCAGITTANHGKPLSAKLLTKSFAQGIAGNTYVLTPSANDFQRALKLLARKIKVTQISSIIKVTGGYKKNTSVFATFLDDDDDDEEEEEDEEDVESVAEKEDANSPEAVAELSEFAPKQADYPFTIFLDPKIAPHGFIVESGRKTEMHHDERFIFELYKNWNGLFSNYGFLSWKRPSLKDIKKGFEPVVVHFTKRPWEAITGEDAWPDLDFFYYAAAQLYTTAQDAGLKAFVHDHIVNIDQHVQRVADGSLVAPVIEPVAPPVAKKEKAGVEIETVTPAPTPAAAAAAATTTTTSTTSTTTTTSTTQPAPIPVKSAWAKK